MPNRKKARKSAKKRLDTFSVKRDRGRPGVRASEISGRSYNYRLILGQIWEKIGRTLLRTKTEQGVIRAFDVAPAYKQEFSSLASLILEVLKDSKFPKRQRPRINFLADSLAARGLVSARRSRDICERERKKKEHFITRQDYYIECTCQYQGPALYGRCPECGTGKLYLPALPFTSEPQF